MDRSDGLVQRKLVLQENTSKKDQTIEEILKAEDNLDRSPKLTLMEELLLIGMKDGGGYTMFWNDSVSIALRGCILIELGLCERIRLEPRTLRRKQFTSRKVVLINDTPTGDVFLDETIKHIKSSTQLETLQNWIRYLSGDSWNLFKLSYRLQNVRERAAKNLAEKGVVTTEKRNYFLFDMVTYPVADGSVKTKLIKKLQDALLTKWVNDPQRINKRTLVVILLAYYSEQLEKVFASVGDSEYDLVSSRVRHLLELDFEEESTKPNSCEIMWAVLEALHK